MASRAKQRPGAPRATTSVEAQVRIDRQRWQVAFVLVLCVTLVFGAIAFGTVPTGTSLAFAGLILTCIAGIAHPFIGVYVIVFVTLVGDAATMTWWPFAKNFSATESIMFVSRGADLQPARSADGGDRRLVRAAAPGGSDVALRRGRLLRPILVFSGFLVFGFVNGVFRGGGDMRTAIFEARAMFYILFMYLLVTNLLTTRRQYKGLLMVALVAISIQSIFSLSFYRGLTALEREETTDLAQHTATIHMNVLFAFLFALLLLKGSKRTIWTVLVLAIPVTWAYVLSQRRAAMISLIIGVLMLMIVLWFKRRRAFWTVAPISVVFGSGFVAATWNATGALGLAATSVKSVIAPEDLGAEEESSNLYRVIESFDLWFTIRSDPVTGRGFGQQFLMPIPLPDISFVEFWQFIPHNSILYMWIKLGFLGFAAMFFMFLRGVQSGARSVLLARTGDDVAIVFAGLSSVVMFVVFAYVDIAWDTRSTVFLAVAFALCADFINHPESTVRREAEPRAWPEMLAA